MQSQSKKWNVSFTEGVSKYCRVLQAWASGDSNGDFRQVLIGNLLEYSKQPAVEWVNNDEFQINFVKMTLAYYYDENIDALEQLHAYDTLCRCLGEAVGVLWRYHLTETNTNTGRCLDNLLREKLVTPPDKGVCCLCLMLASELPITATFEEEIAVSRELCPVLPFSESVKHKLFKIVKKESRLRLTMCMAQILGRSCHKLKLKLEPDYFQKQFVSLLRELALMDNHENVLNELNVILEALICSKKHEEVTKELPPSPTTHDND